MNGMVWHNFRPYKILRMDSGLDLGWGSNR